MTDLVLRARNTTQGGATTFDRVIKAGDNGELVMVDRYQELALRGKVFSFSRAAVTIPANAATLVSVFGIYNPPSSGVFLDVISAEAHAVLATTVVNALGIYYSTPALSALATFTTQLQSAVENARLGGDGPASNARAYSAVTHSGTPALAAIVGGWGAVTDGGATPVRRDFKGSLLIPPGVLVSLAMTTAASTGSGITAEMRWAEIPYVQV